MQGRQPTLGKGDLILSCQAGVTSLCDFSRMNHLGLSTPGHPWLTFHQHSLLITHSLSQWPWATPVAPSIYTGAFFLACTSLIPHNWLATKLPRSHLQLPRNYRSEPLHLPLVCGFWGLNGGPHACTQHPNSTQIKREKIIQEPGFLSGDSLLKGNLALSMKSFPWR